MQTNILNRRLQIVLFLSFICFTFSNCYFNEGAFGNKTECIVASGATVSRTFDMENFSIVYVPDEWSDVTIEKGTHCQVTFEGKENMLEAIDLSTNNDALQFKLNKCFQGLEKVKVTITMPSLKKLSNLTFNSGVHVRGFKGSTLDISNDESAKMDFDVDYEKIICRMNRGGITLTGKTDDLEAYFYTSAGMEAFGLEAKRASIISNSIWTINVRATEQLSVKINDSGDVYYKGNPTIDATISGSGRLINAN
ncbi:MAG: GIN domain-containing protein [Saprospiraceae bacterium]